MRDPNSCPICKSLTNSKVGDYGDRFFVNCPICGHFGITNSALASFEAVTAQWPEATALLSHLVRKTTENDKRPVGSDTLLFDQAFVERLLQPRMLPSLKEQSSNFIIWLGDRLRANDPGAQLHFSGLECAAIMGAASDSSALNLIAALVHGGVLTGDTYIGGEADIGLTLAGWDNYEALRRSHSEGPIAFMAMPFNDTHLDGAYSNHFKPAVGQCGFDLRRIDEKPPAGSIDNRLRVEIRRSRFLIVDLTHHNPGAYWEAGFAEGLGKPVIYTCEKSHFSKTHFDTSHHHTIVWTVDDLPSATTRLKDTVRATLPDEARMAD